MDVVLGKEQYGSHKIKKRYVKTSSGILKVIDDSQKYTSASQFFRSVFLPQGFPESVSEDYVQYQLWDTLQAFCSGITGTLATQAVLKGVGVGDENATVLAATITWMLKSGTGMAGQIIFAWLQGSYLDCDCKRWRLFADMLNDAAIFMEILAPFFQDYFRIIVCVAGVCKSIVGVAGGATRAALTQHQARRNNMADVSAKDGSQETLVNLSALLISLVLIPMVTGHQVLVWILFILFTGLHLFANYSAVTSVAMENFNLARFHIVCQHYLSSPDHQVMGIKAANRREPVVWKTRRCLDVQLGVTLSRVIKSAEEFDQLCKLYATSGYILKICLKSGRIYVVMNRESDVSDQLQAAFQAEILEYAVQLTKNDRHNSYPSLQLQNIVEAARHGDQLSMLTHSYKLSHALYFSFKDSCESRGWDLSHALLGVDEWRAVWDSDILHDKKTY